MCQINPREWRFSLSFIHLYPMISTKPPPPDPPTPQPLHQVTFPAPPTPHRCTRDAPPHCSEAPPRGGRRPDGSCRRSCKAGLGRCPESIFLWGKASKNDGKMEMVKMKIHWTMEENMVKMENDDLSRGGVGVKDHKHWDDGYPKWQCVCQQKRFHHENVRFDWPSEMDRNEHLTIRDFGMWLRVCKSPVST